MADDNAPLTPIEQEFFTAIRHAILPEMRERLSRYIADGGEVWNTQTLQRDFEVLSFLAPFTRVIRKSDGVEGILEFTHSPRFYFDFTPVS